MPSHEITHPYTAILTIDPAQFADFDRLTRQRHEICLLRRDDGADWWTLHVACASEDVVRRLMDGWA